MIPTCKCSFSSFRVVIAGSFHVGNFTTLLHTTRPFILADCITWGHQGVRGHLPPPHIDARWRGLFTHGTCPTGSLAKKLILLRTCHQSEFLFSQCFVLCLHSHAMAKPCCYSCPAHCAQIPHWILFLCKNVCADAQRSRYGNRAVLPSAFRVQVGPVSARADTIV